MAKPYFGYPIAVSIEDADDDASPSGRLCHHKQTVFIARTRYRFGFEPEFDGVIAYIVIIILYPGVLLESIVKAHRVVPLGGLGVDGVDSVSRRYEQH
jgi:hypothetical protein